MDVVMKHQNTKDQPQNSLLGDEILHCCSTVFSLNLAEVKKNDIEIGLAKTKIKVTIKKKINLDLAKEGILIFWNSV